MIASRASGIFTLTRIWSRVAPNAPAASTAGGATSRTPRSTSRTTTGNA